MNQKKKIFIGVWVLVTAALFYFFGPTSKPPVPGEVELEVEVVTPMPEQESVNPIDELPAQLKSRIDNVLSRIEDMWDPTGRKVKDVGERMDALEKALEDNNSELAEKILTEIEVIVSEK